tara:strand:- start:110 stop:700 length:591 start_codon:yes stop_codon:yes gene_type:complete
MGSLKLPHSGGNSVSIAAPQSNPGSDRTLYVPSNADGTIITNATPKTILQVVQGNYTANVTSTDTSYVEISSDLRATITPISATSKLIITYNLLLHISTTAILTVRILKDGSTTVVENAQGGYSSNLQRGNSTHYADSDLFGNRIVQVIDTAGSTSQRYYTPFWYMTSGTRGVNGYIGHTTTHCGTSSYSVMEVAQ